MNWRSDLSAALTKFSETLDHIPELRDKLRKEIAGLQTELEEETTLIVAGEFKAGKSTFVNALLGRSELTVDVLPTTAVMTKLTYGSEKKVLGHFQNGTIKEYSAEWLPQLTAEVGGEMAKLRKELAYVELQLPIERLKTLHIIDSPGLNSSHDEHTEATRSMLDRADILIWVFSYQFTGSFTELEQIDDILRRQIPIIGLVNGIDSHDEEEEALEDFLAGQQRRLQGKIDRLIGVSAREALKAMEEGNQQRLLYSGWPQVDKLINSIKQDSSLMPARVFRRVEILLKQIEEYFTQEKSESCVSRFQPLIDSFISTDFPEMQRFVNKGRKEYEEAYSRVSQWLNIYKAKLRSPEEIQKVTMQLGGKAEELSHYIKDKFSSFKHSFDSYTSQVEPLRKQSDELIQQWPEISWGGLRRFRKIKRFATEMAACQIMRSELEVIHTGLNKTRGQILSDIQSLDTLIKKNIQTAIDPDYTTMDSLSKEWKAKLERLNIKYKEIDAKALDRLDRLYSIHSAFIKAFQPAFISPDKVVTAVDSYQRSKHHYENIKVSLPELSIEQARKDFNEFFRLPSVWSEKIRAGIKGNISADFVTSMLIPHLPQKVDYDAEGLLRGIKKNVVESASLVSLILFIILAYYLSNNSSSKEENNADGIALEQNTPSSLDPPSFTPAATQPVESPEIIPAAAYDPEEIANFLDDMYSRVPSESRTGNFDPKVYFTDEAWQVYEPYVKQFYSNVRTQEINRGIYALRTGEMVAMRDEVYETDNERLTYQVTFEVTTRQDQTLVVSNVSINQHAKEPIGIVADVGAMEQFLQDYRANYFDTLNEDDFRLVSSYLTPDGEAYSELLKYTASISGRGYKFEHVDFKINNIKQSGPNVYVASTSEGFITYDYAVNKQAEYHRKKQYFIRALDKDKFSIDRIVILDTQKQTQEITPQTVEEGNVFDDVYSE
ncbi:hypothetical protein E5161_09430 [Cohnella pontilimi]|uniref:Dynamin family protein n=1 Tax=Cohnella pontilimi TaxID=2564100 RepID=A0A4U0FBY4_9BACL|nr:dynamin family protein [Cohnella pontilimi]TJY42221.1 hypothetical protein E5161_09430 [Cohnella pontilimi]